MAKKQVKIEPIDPAITEKRHRESWAACWGWPGPEVGEPCDINSCSVTLADPSPDGGKSIYAYMERCILLEELPDGRWLAAIDMGIVHGKPWHKDGTRVILGITDIWPPTRDIRMEREGDTPPVTPSIGVRGISWRQQLLF